MNLKSTGLALLAMFAFPFAAGAQDYPERQITMVIPFTPGGSNDVIGRYLADALSKKWDQTVVVENRTGAGGNIGAAYVSKAAPDGYTLLFTSGTYTANAATQDNLPFDPEKDLVPVAPAAASQFMFVAGERVEAENLKDFVEEAKSRKMFYATTGVGSTPHFVAELIAAGLGIEMTPVHYKGSTEPVIDMVGGRVDVYVGSVPALMTAVSSQQVKPLGVTSGERLATVPDVPTLKEGGLEGAEIDQWWGVLTTAGAPEDVVEKINAAINEAMSTPEAEAFLEKYGTVFKPMEAAAFQAMVHDELTKWTTLAAERGIRAE